MPFEKERWPEKQKSLPELADYPLMYVSQFENSTFLAMASAAANRT
jgi:hypothetical protein